MKTLAHCRVLTIGQDTNMQVDEIKQHYPEATIFEEKLFYLALAGRLDVDIIREQRKKKMGRIPVQWWLE
ncbi:hypothetical protein [Halodesulfovibrio aestuarii]|uniref:hypothetical protein n=1 Tax=Halodesulfovibrio aestuarii TaxID=126333 RepID=UPI0012B5EFB9